MVNSNVSERLAFVLAEINTNGNSFISSCLIIFNRTSEFSGLIKSDLFPTKKIIHSGDLSLRFSRYVCLSSNNVSFGFVKSKTKNAASILLKNTGLSGLNDLCPPISQIFTLIYSSFNLYSFLIILEPMVGIYILGISLSIKAFVIEVFPTPQ